MPANGREPHGGRSGRPAPITCGPGRRDRTVLRRALGEPARVGSDGVNDEPAQNAARILTLVAALNRHDRATRGHSERVRAFNDLIAEELRLVQPARDRLRWAVLLHDVGKARGAGPDPQQAGKADRGRVGRAATPSRGGRSHRRAVVGLVGSVGSGHCGAPRTLGRHRLPPRAGGWGHQPRRAHRRRGRRLRGHDHPSPLPAARERRRRPCRACPLRRYPVRPSRRPGVPQRLAGQAPAGHGPGLWLARLPFIGALPSLKGPVATAGRSGLAAAGTATGVGALAVLGGGDRTVSVGTGPP